MATRYAIYIVTCVINAKQYVGITKNLKKRWGEHRRATSRYQSLHAAINKYGHSNFVFTHIADAFNLESAVELEKMLIQQHNTKAPNGYNLTDGGHGVCGKEWTEEERKLKSIATTQYIAQLSKEEKRKKFSSFAGKKHSEEVKKRISESNKKPKPQSSQKGENNAMYGRVGEKNPYFGKKHSEETRAKMKAAWAIRKASGWIDPRLIRKQERELANG